MTENTTNQIDDVDNEDASAPADDLSDLTTDDYSRAAATMAQEATQSQDDALEEGDEPTGREGRYRERLRDTEAERDQLRGLVEGMRRTEVERLASERLADPADVFRDGTALDDVLDDGGAVDAAKLNATIDGLLTAHPHWRRPIGRYEGPLHSGATNTRSADAPADSWASAFAPKAD